LSAMSLEIDPADQRRLERFYHYEARLLDSRQYQQWLTLLSEDLNYIVPSRVNVQIDNRARGSEGMISVERELEDAGAMGTPLREENLFHIALRVERAYKINAWSEQPPARTRRIVGNIELMEQAGDRHHVLSNFHLYYSRPGSATVTYCGQRRDVLVSVPDGFRLARREVILDYAELEFPTVGLFF